MAVIVLALDGFDVDLLKLDEFGNTRDIYKEYHSSLLESTLPYLTPSAFVSMQTGKSVGKHGVSGFLKFDGKETKPYTGSDIKDVTFYEILHAKGKRCFLFSMPYSYPPRIAGDIVFDWLSVGAANIHECVYPSTLLEVYPELVDYELFPDKANGIYEFMLTSKRMNENAIQVIKHAIASKRYDFYFFLIRHTDWIQHTLLKQIIDGEKRKEVNVAKEVFAKVDELIRYIVSNMHSNDSLLILSDHGFKVYNERFYINDWLKEQGYLVTSEKVTYSLEKTRYPFLWDEFSSNIKTAKAPALLSKLARENKTLASIASRLKPKIEDMLNTKFVVGQPIDIEKSQAFSVEDSTGAIYVNRNLSENERESIKKEIIAKIANIKEINVYDSAAIYGKNTPYSVADIYLESSRYWIRRGLEGTIFSNMYIAHHRRQGVLTLVGEAFSNAAKNARIMDIAPTILHIMDCPIPNDMEGRVLVEALSDRYTNKQIMYSDNRIRNVDEQKQDTGLSESEQEIIEERLRRLGYI
ncbi:MAG: alkaline phosphatase family protein [Nitrososphaera sp.]|jgi:predicted AlkP superfamily phosphohydrolase/phosphomutase|uniref:alkaline phosphatase family protein n=1 Tax=Candidatus Nitrosocaldus islandicus TaxID=2045011 RepID=UPI000CD0447F|nr:alkaline phosphatase family protein [Candidatus Nitrosocaldus islandicus]